MDGYIINKIELKVSVFEFTIQQTYQILEIVCLMFLYNRDTLSIHIYVH